MEQTTPPETAETEENRRRPYEKPVLTVHGSVGELTQTGGARRRDGFRTRAVS